jgi:site-specific DNA-methyltransferase (adenine-specific)
MVTSPPYKASKEYDQDLSLEIPGFVGTVWQENTGGAPGGRACINVANLGRKPYIPLHSYIIEQMIEIGFYAVNHLNKAATRTLLRLG